VERKKLTFPMLIGNTQMKKDYKLNAVPLYVLVDRSGKIVFIQEGYSETLEKEVEKALYNK
jgi:hypothetical protein